MRAKCGLAVLYASAMVAAGCATDLRGPDSVCQLHKVEMDSRVVRVPEEPMDPSGYFDVPREACPNCAVYEFGMRAERARLWSCPECERVRAEWIAAHPGSRAASMAALEAETYRHDHRTWGE